MSTGVSAVKLLRSGQDEPGPGAASSAALAGAGGLAGAGFGAGLGALFGAADGPDLAGAVLGAAPPDGVSALVGDGAARPASATSSPVRETARRVYVRNVGG